MKNNNSKDSNQTMKNIKECLDLIQKIFFFTLFVLIIFNHDMLIKWALESPFKGILGSEFKAKSRLEELQELKTGRQEIKQSLENVMEARKELEKVATNQQISNTAKEEINQATSTLQNVENRLKNSTEVMKDRIDTITTSSEGIKDKTNKAIVIFGADKTEQAAQDELKRAYQESYSDDLILLLRADYYRPAILFESEEAAKAELEKIQDKLRESSYIRFLDKWCLSYDEPQKKFFQNNTISYDLYKCKD